MVSLSSFPTICVLSGLPNELNFPFLEHLRLRKIIYLAPEDPDDAFISFVKTQENLDVIYLGSTGRQKFNPLDEETVVTALDIILDPGNYPLYIMCQLGRHRTGRDERA
jgi:tyrosine-protein phosphatase OCA1